MRGIIDAYTATVDFSRAEIGFDLSDDERRRRHLLQSLLQVEGLDEAEYAKKFGSRAREDFARELGLLHERGLLAEAQESAASESVSRLRLTPEGLAWSDSIGPMLFSDPVRAAMSAYALK